MSRTDGRRPKSTTPAMLCTMKVDCNFCVFCHTFEPNKYLSYAVIVSERWTLRREMSGSFVLEKATGKRSWSILVVRAVLTEMRVSVETGFVMPVIATNTSVIVDVSELRQHVTNYTRIIRQHWRWYTLHTQQRTLHAPVHTVTRSRLIEWMKVQCVRKPTNSRLSLTNHVNKCSRCAE